MTGKTTKREWTIPANGEYRFEVDFDTTATIKLLSGTAEVFGAELAPNRDYTFTGQKVAIFSFDSCQISVSLGPTSSANSANWTASNVVEYVSTESVAVPAYLHLFKHDLSHAQPSGRRVLVLGSGRNTLTKTLCNYIVRTGESVLWSSVDVRTTPLFFPGCLTANVMGPLQVVEPEEPGMVSGMASEACSPYVLFFGSQSIADNYKLWLRLVERLAGAVDKRQHHGITIICGPGEQDCEAMPQLPEDLCRLLSIDTIVVVGNERLHARLQRQLSTTVNLVKLAKSGGQVPFPRPNEFDRKAMHRLFTNYFYGHQRQQLNPFSQTLRYNDDFVLFRQLLGTDDVAPMSALPLGATRKLDECRAVRVEPSSALLLYSIIAVLHHQGTGNNDTLSGNALDFKQLDNVAGFMYVTGVDEDRQTITVLSPCPGQPPSRLFLCGKLKWIE